jgi:hypothetical protein
MKSFILILLFIISSISGLFSGQLPNNKNIKPDVSLNTRSNTNRKTVTMKLGQICSYKYQTFYSAGYSVYYKIKNPQILKLVSKKNKYLSPLHGSIAAIGNDKTDVTLFFKAVNYGTTEIVFSYVARGKVTRKVIITIFVQ